MPTKIRTDRLLKMADYLATVPRAKFYMGEWSNGKTGCGFRGCAVGWAVHGNLFLFTLLTGLTR